MLDRIGKYWTLIALLLGLVVLASLFLWPEMFNPLMWVAVIGSISITLLLIVQRHARTYRQKKCGRGELTRNILLDAFGVLLTILGAVWLAGRVAAFVMPSVIGFVEPIYAGAGLPAGISVGLIAAILVGIGAGLIVGSIWRWLVGKLVRTFAA